MKFLRGVGVVCLLSFSLAGAARADGSAFAGQWRQLTSTAGRCDQCYIGIVRHGDLLTVTSNNGWQAVMNVENFLDLELAAGTGQWKSTVAGAYGGKHFGIQFVRRGPELQMFMVVSHATGRPLSIRATFERGLPATNWRHQPAPIEMQRI
ncbi:hypothetical protein IB265_15905 [Ensifer sp. ENS10]|uniref:hypothetical protein n=1 Tax=unclassified Ensifer TaxID=2633371 RepID=UPI000713D40B|nr:MULTISPECIES: hypothetical protein [unclassified Ensifer]KRD60299.1 hypothetical protein ASE60_05170 [Ensifer sp. Root278]MBD9508266.1 hypothetical protein [Ensifer sp. ENS10]MBV7518248.1 hypothetical protein [Ensifer sp. ENS12]